MALRHVCHLPAQLPVVAALGGAVIAQRRARGTAPPQHRSSTDSELRANTGASHISPELELVRTIASPHPALIRDYIEHVGGDPAAYRGLVPPHLFPQWTFPLAARTAARLPYPLTRIVNAGCRLEMNAPLPADGTPLVTRAALQSIDHDGRRALLTQRLVTGTAAEPNALVAIVTALIPLRSNRAPKKRSSVSIPYDAHELARWSLGRDAGLAFAVLTGDFNPIHWLTRAGVAAGFGGPILHGFAMLARAYEGVVRARFAGDASRIRAVDARFTRPLRLPADVGLYARGDDVWIGDASGTAPYLTMTVETRTATRVTPGAELDPIAVATSAPRPASDSTSAPRTVAPAAETGAAIAVTPAAGQGAKR
jgi:acyl dehydratase